jgi:hypothetical protein
MSFSYAVAYAEYQVKKVDNHLGKEVLCTCYHSMISFDHFYLFLASTYMKVGQMWSGNLYYG